MTRIRQSSYKSKRFCTKTESYQSTSRKFCVTQPSGVKSCLRVTSCSEGNVKEKTLKKKVSFLIPRKSATPREESKVQKTSNKKTVQKKVVRIAIKEGCKRILENKNAQPLDSFSSDLLQALNESCINVSSPSQQEHENI